MESLLDRITAVENNLAACTLCPWRCSVNRLRGERGYCHLGSGGHIFHHTLSYSEEMVLSPSYEILLSGCSHRCRFCSVLDWVEEPRRGPGASFEEVGKGLEAAGTKGLRTVSFVGGEPTVNLLSILELLDHLKPPQPIVWNSNMYMTPLVHEILEGVVDTFVADIHFGTDGCALVEAQVYPYFETVTANVLTAASYTDLIVRHLVIPGHERCCYEPIARWVDRELPGVPFHVLDGFLPNGSKTSGETGTYLNEIVIHGDGRVAFKHLDGNLLELALELNPKDSRCRERGRLVSEEAL
jgi:putative pyruvate formate lyase activating enzyme